MGCQQSTSIDASKEKRSQESDDALKNSDTYVMPPKTYRPQSADSTPKGPPSADSWKTLKKSSFKLQPIPPRRTISGPDLGGSTELGQPNAKAPRRLKSALRSRSMKPGDVGGASRSKRTVIFVLGGPGCGKGTQCERIVKEFGFLHLSAGDLLRDEVKKGTPVGKNCDKLMKEGKLVPVEVTLGLIEKAMRASSKSRFLIDGFPRAIDQAKAFEAKICRPDKVLFLECPKDTMQQRLLKRGESSGRSDDNQATIIKRFETFEKESMPVIGFYDSVDKNIVAKVSSVPPPDEVYQEIEAILKKVPGLEMKA